MEPISLLLLAAGIAALFGGSTLALEFLPRIARSLGVSELVVTVLGLSVLTSLPEWAVSGLAAARGGPDGVESALGNVVGSNFVTLTFVLGLCAVVRPFYVAQTIRDRETSWMILSAAVLFWLCSMDGKLQRIDGVILVGLYLPYLVSVLYQVRQERAASAAQERKPLRPLHVLAAVGGMALVIAGADLAVRGGTDMGLALGMTPLAIGAIVFAVGTSLPELTVSLAAVRKGKADVVLGEVYASNIFTATVVLGSTLIIRPLEVVPPALLRVDLPLLVLGAALMQVMATSDLKLERWEGAVAIGLYGWYVYLHLV